ncbi:SixA phosphatase family protein [Microbacterium radiodurans]|uniref:Phosphohistidine phosphatase n=1 Tax=Microbacterium radiodurans TaxID=661398 RepID=A0A5J5IPD2_9MICO|nr:histidine phosphatase family protein [Microbacterium radiodurans]KAA9085493.1 phosphohistidine phosphatase [Microbacterium radiodurans]
MTTLILVRHAKSDWGSPGLDDHERPLNARGRRDAPEMARRVVDAGVRVDRILASTALRARETAASFGEALGLPVDHIPELYGAGGRRLRDTAAASGMNAVLLVAHDPGMTVLAEELSGGRIGQMPTCGVATFTWDTDDWDVASATDPDAWSFDSPRA